MWETKIVSVCNDEVQSARGAWMLRRINIGSMSSAWPCKLWFQVGLSRLFHQLLLPVSTIFVFRRQGRPHQSPTVSRGSVKRVLITIRWRVVLYRSGHYQRLVGCLWPARRSNTSHCQQDQRCRDAVDFGWFVSPNVTGFVLRFILYSVCELYFYNILHYPI